MADTPNNDIEKRLRDYAQQRRDAAGTPELHPATRAMLQAEVKQHLGGAGATPIPARTGLMRFWPRLAFALGVIVLLGMAAIFLVPTGNKPKEPFALAKLEEGKPAINFADKSDAAAVPAPAPTEAPAAMREIAAGSASPASLSVAAETEDLRSRADVPVRTGPAKAMKGGASRDFTKTSVNNAVGSSSLASPPSGAPNGVVQTVGQGSLIAGQDPRKESPAAIGGSITVAKPASPAIQTDALIAKATTDKDLKTASRVAGKKAEAGEFLFNAAAASQNIVDLKLGANGQRYRNIVVAEKQKQPVPAVLDEFTVAQDGEVLTVIDRDGSVYHGYARIAPVERQNYNYNVENANPVQLVPNSGAGGRAGAALDQRAMNRSYQQNQNIVPTGANQSFAFGQAAPSQNAIMPLNYIFRVEGTNRSLNERVVFTGKLLQNTGHYYYNVGNVGGAQNNAINQNYRQQVAPTGNAYFNNTSQNAPAFNNVINGQVQLGDKKPGELNALSVGQ